MRTKIEHTLSIIRFIITSIFLLSYAAMMSAQPGKNDSTFNPYDVGMNYGANGNIEDFVVQNDGKIIIGGDFTSVNGTTINRIARLNVDGTVDATFNPGTGADNLVEKIVVQNDNKIIICGTFYSINGINRNGIARLNVNGSLDNTFDTGTTFEGHIYSMAIQSDGKVIIGGYLYFDDNFKEINIIRLNSNGTLDQSFNPGNGANAEIFSMAIQNDGKLVIGGGFTTYNGTGRKGIARLNSNGSLDLSFNPGTGLQGGSCWDLAIQNDGKIVIGGGFTAYNGTARKGIARLNNNGSLDTSFNPGTGVNDIVFSLVIQTDSKILIGGRFNEYNGLKINNIARINSNGMPDNTFNPGKGPNNTIFSIYQDSNNKILIGGYFTAFNEKVRNRIARLNIEGTIDASFYSGIGANNFIWASDVQKDGKIIIVGNFSLFNGQARNRIARLNINGTIDESFNPGSGPNDVIWAVAIQNDGKIIIGGDFTSYNGVSGNHIARINNDGTLDQTFNPGTGPNLSIYAMCIQNDGKIIIGGNFTAFNGTPKNRIVRLNNNGTLDASFNPGTGAIGSIETMILNADGKIIIGGNLTSYNGTTVKNIARINTNGSLDASFNTGSGPNYNITTIAIQNDGKILIGGFFTSYNGISRNNVARINQNGSLDITFNPGEGADLSVYSVVAANNGKVIVGGNFTTFNGIARNRIAGLNADGTLDNVFNPGTGADGDISKITLLDNGKILIVGSFNFYNEIERNCIERLIGCVNTTGLITATVCNTYVAPDGQVYNSSGIKTAVIHNTAGCDSTITINLTVNKVDVSLTVNDPVIKSNITGAAYQWVDCDNNFAFIPGANNQVFTASRNGNYAVIITQGMCTDTSECVHIISSGTSNVNLKDAIHFYPNPFSQEFNIELDGIIDKRSYCIINSLGQIMAEGKMFNQVKIDAANFSPGIYLLRIGNEKSFQYKKMVKH